MRNENEYKMDLAILGSLFITYVHNYMQYTTQNLEKAFASSFFRRYEAMIRVFLLVRFHLLTCSQKWLNSEQQR